MPLNASYLAYAWNIFETCLSVDTRALTVDPQIKRIRLVARRNQCDYVFERKISSCVNNTNASATFIECKFCRAGAKILTQLKRKRSTTMDSVRFDMYIILNKNVKLALFVSGEHARYYRKKKANTHTIPYTIIFVRCRHNKFSGFI